MWYGLGLGCRPNTGFYEFPSMSSDLTVFGDSDHNRHPPNLVVRLMPSYILRGAAPSGFRAISVPDSMTLFPRMRLVNDRRFLQARGKSDAVAGALTFADGRLAIGSSGPRCHL